MSWFRWPPWRRQQSRPPGVYFYRERVGDLDATFLPVPPASTPGRQPHLPAELLMDVVLETQIRGLLGNSRRLWIAHAGSECLYLGAYSDGTLRLRLRLVDEHTGETQGLDGRFPHMVARITTGSRATVLQSNARQFDARRRGHSLRRAVGIGLAVGLAVFLGLPMLAVVLVQAVRSSPGRGAVVVTADVQSAPAPAFAKVVPPTPVPTAVPMRVAPTAVPPTAAPQPAPPTPRPTAPAQVVPTMPAGAEKVGARYVDPRALVAEPAAYAGRNVWLQGHTLTVRHTDQQAAGLFSVTPSQSQVQLMAQVRGRGATESIAVMFFPKEPRLLSDECVRVYGIVTGTQDNTLVFTGAKVTVPEVRGYAWEGVVRGQYGCPPLTDG